MENRLKERLTGAAILVALIVLIVPELFRGQSSHTVVSNARLAPEGAPIRSYTIELNAAGAQASSPAPSPTPPQEAAQAPPQAAATPHAAAPSRGTATLQTPSAAAPVPAASHAPAHSASSDGHNTLGPAARKPASAGAAARASLASVRGRTAHPGGEAPGHAAKTASPGWSVQLGVFSKAENATRLARSARGKGFSVRVSRTSRGLYRVALVGLSERAEALRVSRRLHAAGLPAAVQGPR